MNVNLSRIHHPAHAQIAGALAWLRAHAQPHADLCADTRALKPGDVFMAYAVEGADNRPFIANAMECGAAAVLYQPEGFFSADKVDATRALAVPALDVLAGEIASGWYGDPSDDMLVIGITGTNGKTSCSQWIAAALGASGTRCAMIGTLGSGLPGQLVQTGFTTPDAPQLQRSLAQLKKAGAQAVAMEVSSHALHQDRANGTAFDIAVFTNLTQDHLDYHHTLAAYEAAKARLFAWPGLRCAVINADDAAGRRLLAKTRGHMRTIAYGLGSEAQTLAANADDWLSAANVRVTAMGTAFHLQTSAWGEADVQVQTLGLFNVSNLLGVLGALLAAGMPFTRALAELAKLEAVNGRMQRLGGRLDHKEPLVVIDYAHTPDALEKTLDALRPIATARSGALVCVFGCGGDRDATKRPLMGAIAERCADKVVVTSDNPRSEAPGTIIDQIVGGMREANRVCRIENRARAILQAVRGAAREDVVLLAGKGHEMTQEIMGKKREFSDQEHARLALAARVAQDVARPLPLRGEGA